MSQRIGIRAGQLMVEWRAKQTLEQWMPSYVVAAARRYAEEGVFGLTVEAMEEMLRTEPGAEGPVFPFRPRGYSIVPDFQDWATSALPQLQIVSPSFERQGGDQTGIAVKYELQVATLAGAADLDNTRLLRACCEDAVEGAILDHQALGGLANGIDLVGGGAAKLTEIDGEDARTLQGSATVFEVEVRGVLDARLGPSGDPLPDEEGVPPDYPDAPTLGEEGAEVIYEAEGQ